MVNKWIKEKGISGPWIIVGLLIKLMYGYATYLWIMASFIKI